MTCGIVTSRTTAFGSMTSRTTPFGATPSGAKPSIIMPLELRSLEL
jgi:hypothetical protein